MPTDILPLVHALWSTGLAFAQSNIGANSEARLHTVLAGQAGTAIVTPEDLSNLIKRNAPFSTAEQRRFIRLADTNDGRRTISPLIYLDGDFSHGHPQLRVQLVLVTHDAAGNDPQSLLLRFESPEGIDPAGAGKHDYYHSQICVDLRRAGPASTFTVPGRISWTPSSCPAWPLDASGPIHLLACVIFALYGKVDGAGIMRLAYGSQFLQQLDGMHFVFEAPPPQPRRRRGRRRR